MLRYYNEIICSYDVAPMGLSASFPSDEGSPKAGVGTLIGCRPDGAIVMSPLRGSCTPSGAEYCTPSGAEGYAPSEAEG